MPEDESTPVGVPSKATRIVPGPPVEIPAVMGATFAERAKANRKAVSGGDAENKAVSPSETKARRRSR